MDRLHEILGLTAEPASRMVRYSAITIVVMIIARKLANNDVRVKEALLLPWSGSM